MFYSRRHHPGASNSRLAAIYKADAGLRGTSPRSRRNRTNIRALHQTDPTRLSNRIVQVHHISTNSEHKKNRPVRFPFDAASDVLRVPHELTFTGKRLFLSAAGRSRAVRTESRQGTGCAGFWQPRAIGLNAAEVPVTQLGGRMLRQGGFSLAT